VDSDVFSASVVEHDSDLVVVLSGELDMATAPELARVLGTVLDSGPTELVLDFSELSFIDSSGIAVLVESQHRLTECGRHLTIHAAHRHTVRVFEIAGLLDFLNVVTETEESPTT
jgi:anti-sigma B factor antagonist